MKNAAYAIDENINTISNTPSNDSARQTKYPAELAVDMGSVNLVKGFTYLPRQDKLMGGIVDKYVFYVSGDGVKWNKVIEGEFSNIKSNPVKQFIQLQHPVNARCFKFSAVHVVEGSGLSVAELGITVK